MVGGYIALTRPWLQATLLSSPRTPSLKFMALLHVQIPVVAACNSKIQWEVAFRE